MKLSLALILAFINAAPTKGKFEGDQVFRLNFESDAEKAIFDQLNEKNNLNLDIWSESKSKVEVRVPYTSLDGFKESTKDIKSEVFIDNVQDLIDQENVSTRRAGSSIYSNYQSTEVLFDYVSKLPGTTPINIGKTYEGASIRGVSFGNGSKSVVFNGGVHAREWISPATVTYITEFLTSDDPRAIKLRGMYTFYSLPVINIDVSLINKGYEFTRKANRMWRKNRQPNQGSSCIGTDINRNFEFKWSEPGASGNPCQETYYGKAPNSTPEAAALDNFVGTLSNVVSYIDFHSYGQTFLYSWGWTCTEDAPYTEEYIASTSIAAEAIKKSSGNTYEYGQSCRTYYPTSGTTDDHMYVKHGVKYAITLELRDSGRYGFVLPANQIEPTGQEVVAGLIPYWAYIFEHS